ncbi:hypothetical protein VNO77_34063 [Canavalia gladiata]|uniref:Uncharacterized protein n=1 Tax=Canavalia gladiata TaxID=3824 RepID=A0AAN9Q1F3_CANGL
MLDSLHQVQYISSNKTEIFNSTVRDPPAPSSHRDSLRIGAPFLFFPYKPPTHATTITNKRTVTLFLRFFFFFFFFSLSLFTTLSLFSV